jgi:hypothetical protein
LHLRITNRSGTWYCAEVVSEESFGYAKYTFYLDGRPDLFDRNVVLGLFTYLDDYHEIDIEFSGGYYPNNSQYVIQPKEEHKDEYIEGDNLHRFQMTLSKGEYSTHYFDWWKDQVHFKSMYEYRSDTDNSSLIIAEKNLDGGDVAEIPTPSNEKVHINLWLVDADKDGHGDSPSNDQEVEIIIKDFRARQEIS